MSTDGTFHRSNSQTVKTYRPMNFVVVVAAAAGVVVVVVVVFASKGLRGKQ